MIGISASTNPETPTSIIYGNSVDTNVYDVHSFKVISC